VRRWVFAALGIAIWLSFPLEIQLLQSNGSFCRPFEKLPAILSEFFLIFVLSPAREAVMFTNRSNYLSDAKQRQLAIFRRNKTNKRAGN
jgi:hypothetical protein